ncbi:unnamed protein product [Polarella glacialis]|uniref:Uncharacterized protein n=1 Tax=Polarella glacialis TaxID=89957 RepID=A0A813JUF4_POLGL|nr:unnamed protein product [Polarella glacialis]
MARGPSLRAAFTALLICSCFARLHWSCFNGGFSAFAGFFGISRPYAHRFRDLREGDLVRNRRNSGIVVSAVAPGIDVASTARLKADLLNVAAWNDFGHAAGVGVGSTTATSAAGKIQTTPDLEAMHQQMQHDGYSRLQRSNWDGQPDDPEKLQSFVRIIDQLEAAGLPAQFMLVFDEVWEVVNAVSRALEPIYGLRNVMDFYVFNVKPGKVGWNLHRDRPEGKLGFHDSGLPEYTTVWIALTDASPATSCIYILPAHADPEYRSMAGSKLDREVISYSLQHIRALPATSGSVLVWSHRSLHWGSAAPQNAPQARKTLTFAMAAPSYEEPFIRLEPGEIPPFEARLVLVAYTLICYHHSQPVPPNMQSALVEIIQRHSDHLTVAAIVQATGESFFKNMLSFRTSGDAALEAQVESAGDLVLKRFGMNSDWWHAACAPR